MRMSPTLVAPHDDLEDDLAAHAAKPGILGVVGAHFFSRRGA
jgi:hypothetical protein